LALTGCYSFDLCHWALATITITVAVTIAVTIASIIYLSLGELYINCLGTAVSALALLKFHFLPFTKAIKFHPFKIVAMEEEVFFLL